jgi:hypothetical protein
MLSNEKYTGEVLLPKTYTTNFLTQKRVENKGEIPQYYVEESHPAIIDKETTHVDSKKQTLITFAKSNFKVIYS